MINQQVLLLGASGYIGSAFAKELDARGIKWIGVPHNKANAIRHHLPYCHLVINCAAFIPEGSVSECEKYPEETIRANLMLPMLLAQVCNSMGVPMAHISTGCLWNDGKEHAENDPPQTMFQGRIGFYVGIKAMAEMEVRSTAPMHYIWRLHLPFDEWDSPRNYLSKLMSYERINDNGNTISHRGDFVKACLDLWDKRATYGTYHVANPGILYAVEAMNALCEAGIAHRIPPIVPTDGTDTNLCVDKLLATGVKMRSVHAALNESIAQWKPSGTLNVQTNQSLSGVRP